MHLMLAYFDLCWPCCFTLTCQEDEEGREGVTSLFVKNLSFATTDAGLKAAFRGCKVRLHDHRHYLGTAQRDQILSTALRNRTKSPEAHLMGPRWPRMGPPWQARGPRMDQANTKMEAMWDMMEGFENVKIQNRRGATDWIIFAPCGRPAQSRRGTTNTRLILGQNCEEAFLGHALEWVKRRGASPST